MTVNGNLTVHNMQITPGILKMVSNVCREVDETDEERHARFINLCPCLVYSQFSNGSYSYRLARRRANDRIDVQSSAKS